MTSVAIEKAERELTKLIDRARAGEEIVITRGNEPLAKLVGVSYPRQPRKPGALKGKMDLPDSFFFDPLPADEIARWWGGRELK